MRQAAARGLVRRRFSPASLSSLSAASVLSGSCRCRRSLDGSMSMSMSMSINRTSSLFRAAFTAAAASRPTSQCAGQAGQDEGSSYSRGGGRGGGGISVRPKATRDDLTRSRFVRIVASLLGSDAGSHNAHNSNDIRMNRNDSGKNGNKNFGSSCASVPCVGSLTEKQILEALQALAYYTRQQTSHGADVSGRILHRLLDEHEYWTRGAHAQSALGNSDDADDADFADFVGGDTSTSEVMGRDAADNAAGNSTINAAGREIPKRYHSPFTSRAQITTDHLNYVIDRYRIHSGSAADVPRGTLAKRADGLLRRVERDMDGSVFNEGMEGTEGTGTRSRGTIADERKWIGYEGGGNGTAAAVVRPDFRSYNMVLDAYAKLGNATAAQQILTRMSDRSHLDASVRPDTVSYNTLLNAWSKSSDPDAPHRAEEILQQMQDRWDGGDPDVRPDTVSFASVMTAWARSEQEGAAERAEDILHRMLQLSREGGGRPDLRPNEVVYSTVLDAWAKSDAVDAAEKVEAILELMSQELAGTGGGASRGAVSEGGSAEDQLHPDGTASAAPLSSAIIALSKSDGGGGKKSGVLRAERLLRSSSPRSRNAVAWTALIDAYARSGRRDAGTKAEAILDEMIACHERQAGRHGEQQDVRPTTVTFNAVINAIGESGDRDAGTKAEAILERMRDLSASGDSIRPDAQTYASLIDAWCGSGDAMAGKRANQILDDMDELYRRGDESMKPDLYCYSAAINAWSTIAGGRNRDGGRQAEALLRRMNQLYEDGQEGMKPNHVCYGAVLNAYAKSGDAEKAETFLEHLESLYGDGDEDAKPSNIFYSATIDSLVRSGRKDAPERCEALVERMKAKTNTTPSVWTMNAVINAFAKSGRRDAAERAEGMLRDMFELGDESSLPNSITFNTCISAWAKSRHPEAPQRAEELLKEMETLHSQGNDRIKADTISYSAVLAAYARSRQRGGAERAESILTHMQRIYEATGNEDVKPNMISVSTVISAWAKRRDPSAADRALQILDWAYKCYHEGNRDVRPNVVAWNSCITALARSGKEDKASQAEDLLRNMKKRAEDGDVDVRPTRTSYNSVISCFSIRPPPDAINRVEALVGEMKTLSQRGELELAPDAVTMTSFLTVLAKSRVSDKAIRAYSVLLDMEEQFRRGGDESIMPNVYTYDAVLRACAFSGPRATDQETQRQALRVAVETLTKLQESTTARSSPYTYDTFFIACANLTHGTQYRRLVEKAFESCCEDGLLNDAILHRIKETAPKGMLETLVGGNEQAVQYLPPEWSRNAAHSTPTKRDSRRNEVRHRELRGERPRATGVRFDRRDR